MPIAIACFSQLTQHVSFTIFPGALLYRVIAEAAGPEAETIVMLGSDDDALCAGIPRNLCPLPAIQRRRIEYRRVFRALAPFHIRKCIWTEMHEEIEFHFMPFHLFGTWRRTHNVYQLGIAEKASHTGQQ